MFKNITSEDVQRYARIALQYLAAYLMTHGMIKPNASWVEPAIGLGVGIATFIWTLYGNRIVAKLNEIAKVPGTVIITTPELAGPDTSTNVVSNTNVKVVRQ